MITKLTAENAELYYAPRFAQISQALGRSITSLEDYFLNLTDIYNLQNRKGIPGSFLLVVPADEEIFEINANTRAITVPSSVKKNGIGVYGDHRAEMIVLSIDRYFDVQDLADTQIAINWAFTRAGSKAPLENEQGAIAAFAPTDEIIPGKILFGFIITKDMTPAKGNLTFSVTFYDNRSNEIVYSLNTLTATVAINDTITLVDPSIVTSDSSGYLSRLTNSVYVDNNIGPVSMPAWRSGYRLTEDDGPSGLQAGAMSGLAATAYLNSNEDLANAYVDGIELSAYAIANPGTADVSYQWTYSPINGTVEMGREYSSRTINSDYIAIDRSQLEADGIYYKETDAGQIDVINAMDYTAALAEEDDVTLYVRGSSYKALAAGNYQVNAQAFVGASGYTKVLNGTVLQATTQYFEKNNSNEYVELTIQEAIDAQAAHKDLYVYIDKTRSSSILKSKTLEIPAAKKPVANLSVSTQFAFDENTSLEEDLGFTYISDTTMPSIVANVDIPDGNNEDKAGVFAVELIESDAADLTLADINDKIANNDLVFASLPADGMFNVATSNMGEGEYVVRAINRRNGTYSVSDPSNVMKTSFVAPAVTNFDVKQIIESSDPEEEDTEIEVLVNGARPTAGIARVEITRLQPVANFQLVMNAANRDGAVVSFEVEEVQIDANDVITPVENDANEPDIYEVVNENGVYSFAIEEGGDFRVKAINRYNGTKTIAYSDVFHVTSGI